MPKVKQGTVLQNGSEMERNFSCSLCWHVFGGNWYNQGGTTAGFFSGTFLEDGRGSNLWYLEFFKNSLSFFQEFLEFFQEILEFHEFLPISHSFHENYHPFFHGNHGFLENFPKFVTFREVFGNEKKLNLFFCLIFW